MKKLNFFLAAALLSALFSQFTLASTLDSSEWLRNYKNSGARDMCMAESFDTNVDNILLEEIPSILEECGIGGIFDFCGLLGKFGDVLGPYIGCGGSGGGGNRSLFCDWGFDAKSAKEAWRVYKRNSNIPDLKDIVGQTSVETPMKLTETELAQLRLKVIGLNVATNVAG